MAHSTYTWLFHPMLNISYSMPMLSIYCSSYLRRMSSADQHQMVFDMSVPPHQNTIIQFCLLSTNNQQITRRFINCTMLTNSSTRLDMLHCFLLTPFTSMGQLHTSFSGLEWLNNLITNLLIKLLWSSKSRIPYISFVLFSSSLRNLFFFPWYTSSFHLTLTWVVFHNKLLGDWLMLHHVQYLL